MRSQLPRPAAKASRGKRPAGTPAAAVPDKLYFRIGEVAKLCSVETYVLRFWETEFSQLRPTKSGTGQRLYRKRDVETALRIRHLLYEEGYTIPGARQAFQMEAHSAAVAAAEQSALPLESSGPRTSPLKLERLRAELRTILGMLSTPPIGKPRLVRKDRRPEPGSGLFPE